MVFPYIHPQSTSTNPGPGEKINADVQKIPFNAYLYIKYLLSGCRCSELSGLLQDDKVEHRRRQASLFAKSTAAVYCHVTRGGTTTCVLYSTVCGDREARASKGHTPHS